ncbi:hypothetical protein MAR_035343 [Mya arenaria]|uniref:EF-hand domain-containing protein n=1 Tax=Mya arenaria TaxID=6604 RepID=A0ABY7EJU7_MYAAR|nr:hypothetical protein MAR_035343 [Mya arenaria]
MDLSTVVYVVVVVLLNVNNGVCQGNTVDVKASNDKGKVKGSIAFKRNLGGGWSVNAGGWADNKGGSGASVGVSLKFKRSAHKIGSLFTVTLKADQCDFKDLGGGWSVNAGGWADNKGGSGGSVGVSFKFKRSAQKIGPLLTVTLKADQCDFKFYDTNGDGVILPDEMIAIFDNTYSTRILFQNLDIINENGKIEQLEFERVSPTVIDGCAVKQ